MDNNTKLEIAKEIMASMIGLKCRKGFNPEDEQLQTLIKESNEMAKFNIEVIDKIINVYGPIIKNEGKK